MFTDDEARDLLHRAGQTVAVDPAPPVVEPGRRRVWPLLAAAAAIVAIAVAAVLVTAPGTKDPAPTPPLTDEVQIPSVLGYNLEAALTTLHDVGFSTSVEPVPTCAAEYVRGTRPAAGTPLEPGSEVVVQNGVPGQSFCIAEDQLAVDLLALADGRGDGPPLADDLEVYDAAGHADLDTVLGRLSAAAHAFYPSGSGRYGSPVLTVDAPLDNRGLPPTCRYATPLEAPTVREHEMARIGVAPPAAQPGGDLPCAELALDVYLDRQGRIDRIVENTLGEGVAPETDPVPTIGTAFRDFARGGDLPPIAGQVDLYLGNAFTGFVTRTSATDRRAWATCTEVGGYAGRNCPLSPLEVLKRHRAVEYTNRPQGLCMPTYGPVPPDLRALDRVVIVPVPDSIDMCAQNFAVQLFTNDNGELVAVSLLLGEP